MELLKITTTIRLPTIYSNTRYTVNSSHSTLCSPKIRYTTTPAKEHFLDYVCSNPNIQLKTSYYQIHLKSVILEIIVAVVKRLSFVIWPQSVTSQEKILFKRNLHNGSITVNPILLYS
jgi:hypothetical protein